MRGRWAAAGGWGRGRSRSPGWRSGRAAERLIQHGATALDVRLGLIEQVLRAVQIGVAARIAHDSDRFVELGPRGDARLADPRGAGRVEAACVLLQIVHVADDLALL